jgi:DNA-binding transcriptional regulator YiaG
MNEQVKLTVAEQVKAARLNLGLEQVEFAGLLGVHPITVSRWERGHAMPSPWQRAIVNALRTSPRGADILDCVCSRGTAAALALGLQHLNNP